MIRRVSDTSCAFNLARSLSASIPRAPTNSCNRWSTAYGPCVACIPRSSNNSLYSAASVRDIKSSRLRDGWGTLRLLKSSRPFIVSFPYHSPLSCLGFLGPSGSLAFHGFLRDIGFQFLLSLPMYRMTCSPIFPALRIDASPGGACPINFSTSPPVCSTD